MRDLETLLASTAPTDLEPIDLPAIRGAARRRARRRRVATAGAAAVVVGLAAGALVAMPRHRVDPGEPVRSVSPDDRTLTPGMGTWTRLPDAPFAAASDLRPLSDGRLLAWGNSRARVGDDRDPGHAGFEVAIYDPERRAWSATERPPGFAGLNPERALYAHDRLVLLGMDAGGEYSGAVFDARHERWGRVPAIPHVKVDAGELAWDGRTLISVRTAPGEVGPVAVGAGSHDPTDPSDGVATIDWRIDAPVTHRWLVGADTWTIGAPPPLTSRVATGAASDGRLLAVVGGTTNGTIPSDASSARRDGAVYDIAADRWAELPPVPWRAVHPGVGWVGGRLVVGGGSPSLDGIDATGRRVVQLASNGRSWIELPDSPVGGVAVNGPTGSHPNPAMGQASIVRTDPTTFDPDHPEGSALVDGAWEPTPHRTYDDWDGLLVSTTSRVGNGGDRPFEVQVRRARNDWVQTSDAPFSARMDPGVAVVRDRLYVVGGLTGRELDPDPTLWVLDLSATRER